MHHVGLLLQVDRDQFFHGEALWDRVQGELIVQNLGDVATVWLEVDEWKRIGLRLFTDLVLNRQERIFELHFFEDAIIDLHVKFDVDHPIGVLGEEESELPLVGSGRVIDGRRHCDRIILAVNGHEVVLIAILEEDLG